MLTLYICLGLPGSGKSTVARRMVNEMPTLVEVNRDAIREMLHGERAFNAVDESLTTKMRDMMIAQALLAGRSVICSDTNLHTILYLSNLAAQFGAHVKVLDFVLSAETCIERDRARGAAGGRSVGAETILAMVPALLKARELVNSAQFERIVTGATQ